jgi:hypothetical protein
MRSVQMSYGHPFSVHKCQRDCFSPDSGGERRVGKRLVSRWLRMEETNTAFFVLAVKKLFSRPKRARFKFADTVPPSKN